MEPKRKKVGLITFGLSLIFIGVVSLLNQYYDIPILRDYYLLWPVFLIILGLEFILTKLYYDFKKTEVQLSPSGISIFLIILVLFTSFIWATINKIPSNFNINWGNNNWQNYRYQITHTYDSGPIELDNAEKISINNIRGRITVQPSEENILEVEANIKAATNDREKAMELMEQVISINKGPTTTIRSINPSTENEMGISSVDLVVKLPKKAAVTVKTSFGDILVTAIDNDVNIQQRHAGVEVEDINGNVKVENEHGAVEVSRISGDAEIENRHGQVDVADIGGSVEVENSYNDTKVKNVKQDLVINSRHGEVEAVNISGDAEITNEYNETSCYNIGGDLKLDCRHSTLDLEDINGDIKAETSYNPISLSNKSFENSDIKASTDYGNITAKGLNDINISSDKNYQEARATYGDGSQGIVLKNRHGDIRIELE